jgi:N-acetylglucosamine-6-sulfatase
MAWTTTLCPAGWDEWYGKPKEQKLYDYDINENGEVVPYGNATEEFFTDVLSGQATEFVRQAAPDDKPFFAYVAPTAPHEPATPPSATGTPSPTKSLPAPRPSTRRTSQTSLPGSRTPIASTTKRSPRWTSVTGLDAKGWSFWFKTS